MRSHAVTRGHTRSHAVTCGYTPPRCLQATILKEISRPLTEDIALHKCAAVLKTLHVMEANDVGLDRAISLALQRVAFVSGDCIIREGEPASAMYFVTTGEVEVWKSSKVDGPVTKLGVGSFFGEMALLAAHGRSLASVRA